jgi:hypothetical protein
MVFFVLPTDIVTEWGIIDEGKGDGYNFFIINFTIIFIKIKNESAT